MKYSFVQHNLDIIYYIFDDHDNEHHLYFNQNKVASQGATLGTKVLEHENIKLEVTRKITKIVHTLTVDGKELSLTKIKKKALKELLSSKNIYNDINPTAEEIEARRFKLKSLTFPFIFFSIAMIIEYFTHDRDKIERILFIAIPCFISAGALFGILTEQFRFLKNIRKLSIFLVMMMVILVLTLSQFIYGVRF